MIRIGGGRTADRVTVKATLKARRERRAAYGRSPEGRGRQRKVPHLEGREFEEREISCIEGVLGQQMKR